MASERRKLEVKLEKITKENAEEYAGLLDEPLLENDLVVGVGCLDEEENPIGAALLSSDGERLIISSLYVEEGSRLKGAGSLILDGISDMSEAAGTGLIEACFTGEDAESFFLKNDFLVSECAPVYRIKASDLTAISGLEKHKKDKRQGLSFKDVKGNMKDRMNRILGEMGNLSLVEQYDQDLSFVYQDDDGNPKAFLLTNRYEEEALIRVEQLVNMDTEHPEYAIGVLVSGINGLRAMSVSPETEVEFVATNEKIYKFLVNIMGGDEKIKGCGSLLRALKVSA